MSSNCLGAGLARSAQGDAEHVSERTRSVRERARAGGNAAMARQGGAR